MGNLKRRATAMMIAALAAGALSGCSTSSSYTFRVGTDDEAKVTLDTSGGGYSLSQEDGRFHVTKDGERVLTGAFIDEDAFARYWDAGLPYAERYADGYICWAVDGEAGTEHDHLARLSDGIAVIAGGNAGGDDVGDAWGRLSFEANGKSVDIPKGAPVGTAPAQGGAGEAQRQPLGMAGQAPAEGQPPAGVQQAAQPDVWEGQPSAQGEGGASALAAYPGLGGRAQEAIAATEAYFGCGIASVADDGSGGGYEMADITMEDGRTAKYFHSEGDGVTTVSDGGGDRETIWASWMDAGGGAGAR